MLALQVGAYRMSVKSVTRHRKFSIKKSYGTLVVFAYFSSIQEICPQLLKKISSESEPGARTSLFLKMDTFLRIGVCYFTEQL